MAIHFEETPEADNPELAAGMNITPLIDVLLVLLVMIIITVPIPLHSVNLELPAGAPTQPQKPPAVVRIEVSASNQLRWNGVPLANLETLNMNLHTVAALPEQPEIHVLADPRTKYDAVAGVLTAAQRQGLQKIGVVGLEDYAR